MKNKFFLILAIILVFASSGCAELDKVSEGASNLVCLARGDIDCIRQAYGPPFGENLTEEGPVVEENRTVEKKTIGLRVSKLNLEDAVKGYNSNGVLSVENTASDTYTASNVDYNIKIYGKVSVYSQENFKVPINWEYTGSIDEVSPGDMETITFEIPSREAVFEPSSYHKYKEKCKGYCEPEEPPWDFKVDLKLSYDYKSYEIFPYRVYDRKYYENHVEKVENELSRYCDSYKGSQAQSSSSYKKYRTPVSFLSYTRSCKLFEGNEFLLKVKATSDHDFEILDDSELSSKGCEREGDLRGDPNSSVSWRCGMRASGEVSAGETSHFIFEVPYRVHMEKKEAEKFKIIKE